MTTRGAHVASGKVREIYAYDSETLALVASDRISTFDVVLPTPIPDKGRVLTGLSAFWFGRTRAIVPNHLISLGDDGRTMVCRKLEMLPIECVVRGYLAGSGWKDYRVDRERLRSRASGRAPGVRAAARADLHARDQGRPRVTTRTSPRSARPSCAVRGCTARRRPCLSSSTDSVVRTRRPAG